VADPETDEEVQNELDRMFVLDAAFDLIHLLKPHGAFSAVMGQARDEAREAVKQLVRADPFKPELIRDLQWRIQRFDALVEYVNAILEAGRVAHADITEGEALKALREIRGEENPTED
jgi:hypothetical protein